MHHTQKKRNGCRDRRSPPSICAVCDCLTDSAATFELHVKGCYIERKIGKIGKDIVIKSYESIE